MKIDSNFIKLFLTFCMGSFFLSGCDLFQSAEEKINAAIPLSEELQIAKTRMGLHLTPPQNEQFEKEYQNKLKLRALFCSNGYTPSLFDTVDDVSRHFQNRRCFSDQDKAIASWLKLRLVGSALSEPSLRPIPKGTFKYTTGGYIRAIDFADRAGVVLVQTNQDVQIVDMNTQQTIFKDSTTKQLGSLSPNGRLFVSGRNGTNLEIHDAVSGESLLEIPKSYGLGLFWLGNTMALYNETYDKVRLINFSSGTDTSIDNISGQLIDVVPADDNNQFLVKTSKSISNVDMSGTELTILSSAQMISRAVGRVQKQSFTPDMHTSFYITANMLKLNFLETQSQEDVSFQPLRLTGAVPSTDPDKIIVSIYGGSPSLGLGIAKGGYYLYSISNKTITQLDLNNPLTVKGIMYAPSIKKNLILRNASIESVDHFSLGEPTDLADFSGAAQLEMSIKRLGIEGDVKAGSPLPSASSIQNNSTTYARRMSAPARPANAGSSLIGAPHVQTGTPFSSSQTTDALINGTELHVVSVYEGPVHFGGKPVADPSASTITVKVHVTKHPITLLLCNYEAVLWNIESDNGVNIKQIVLDSAEGSVVRGINEKTVSVTRKRTGCAYGRETRGLAAKSNQYLYRGVEFSVGP